MRLFFPVTSPLMFTQSLTWDSAGHKHPKRHSQGKAQVDRQVLPVLLLARGHLGGGATSKQLQAHEMKSCVSLIQQSGEDRSKQKPENGGDPDVMTPCSAAAFVSSSFFFLFYEPHFQRTCFMICAVNVHCPDRWETQTNITAHSRSLMSNMPPSLPPSLSSPSLPQPPPLILSVLFLGQSPLVIHCVDSKAASKQKEYARISFLKPCHTLRK